MINLKRYTGEGSADALNVFLILASLGLAFLLPFTTFLISYAVLGPLHYMTEINWLNDRKFFVKSFRWMWLFVLIAIVLSIPVVANLPVFQFSNQTDFIKSAIFGITSFSDILLLSVLLLAVGLLFLKKWWHIALFFAGSLLLSKLLTDYVLNSYILAGIFLPTLIHVYLFTLLFMVLGALNSGKKMAFVGVGLLLLSPIVIFCVSVSPDFYLSFESTDSVSTSGNFRFINALGGMFGANENGAIIPLSSLGLKIQTLVAFAYTYHYLNWFSKVTVIGWRKTINPAKAIVIALLWVGSIALFFYDYGIAYLTLFFMAILHIVLEFPLNALSVKMILQKTGMFKVQEV